MITKYFTMVFKYPKIMLRVWEDDGKTVDICWAITVESSSDEGRTRTQTIIVRTNKVLQFVLEPDEYVDRTQFNPLSSSKGLS